MKPFTPETHSFARHFAMLAAPCQLYRHFDKSGALLYVGISKSAKRRGFQHRSTAHWAADIARTTVQDFPTRTSAIEAEARAIAFEHPLHNKRRPLRAAIPKNYPHPVCPALPAIYGEAG